jgi:HD superfamily phosphohydrolase
MKSIKIPVHGLVEIPELCMKIIDTPEFQRLRSLRQCGFVEYVYPGASHTRFEHSLGVCYLAGVMARRIQSVHPEYNITSDDILQVQVYGLVHDIAHGPFSHTFEHFSKKSGVAFCHEKMGDEMFELLIKNNNIDHKIIKNKNIKNFDKLFLKDIVSNEHDGIDVDKMDYILRDANSVNISIKCDIHRIIQNCKIVKINNEYRIAYPEKLIFDILDLFQTRFHLHRIVYQHRVVSAIETMAIQAMIYYDKENKENKENKFSDVANNVELLSATTDDSVFQKIMNGKSENAKKLIKRIKQRKLLEVVAVFVNFDTMDDLSLKNAIVSGLDISIDDIYLNRISVNYGHGSENPLDRVIFFENDKIKKYNSVVSELCPYKFGLMGIRVFADSNIKNFTQLKSKWSHTLLDYSELIS